MKSINEASAVLRHRQFRSFWIGRVVSSLGSAIAPIAVAFAALDAGGGAQWLGLILALNVAPQVLLLLIGGVLGDRVRRDRVMMAANCVSGVVQLSIAILILTGVAELWMLAASVFMLGCASAFFQPASQGSIVQLVPAPLRVAANAVLRLPLNVAKVLGPALGGLLVALLGSGWALAFNSATFVISVFFLAAINSPQPLKPKASAIAEFKAGFKEFTARRWFVIMVAQSAITVLMWLVGFQLFGPVISQESLGGAMAWGMISAGFAFGMVGGSVIAIAVRPQRIGITVSLCLAAQALPLIALACVAPTWVIVAATVVAGVALDISIVSWSAFFQEQIPESLQSRLSSISTFGQLLPVPLGYVLFGLLSQKFSTTAMMSLFSGILLVAALVPLLIPLIRSLKLGQLIEARSTRVADQARRDETTLDSAS
ncbi:MFS transporter [Arthrobacter sp. MYb227]|uniref:MFS transporter n=1 Tax=Arthrobacter sp. MYb227 TaxID=1848601 RepID=UPI000CFCDAF8|nr:MFS transporter [Arthrobacter sp. MYb227]PQZ88603.1 MFS transporter [Arthrobacter sp. MYb227]